MLRAIQEFHAADQTDEEDDEEEDKLEVLQVSLPFSPSLADDWGLTLEVGDSEERVTVSKISDKAAQSFRQRCRKMETDDYYDQRLAVGDQILRIGLNSVTSLEQARNLLSLEMNARRQSGSDDPLQLSIGREVIYSRLGSLSPTSWIFSNHQQLSSSKSDQILQKESGEPPGRPAAGRSRFGPKHGPEPIYDNLPPAKPFRSKNPEFNPVKLRRDKDLILKTVKFSNQRSGDVIRRHSASFMDTTSGPSCSKAQDYNRGPGHGSKSEPTKANGDHFPAAYWQDRLSRISERTYHEYDYVQYHSAQDHAGKVPTRRVQKTDPHNRRVDDHNQRHVRMPKSQSSFITGQSGSSKIHNFGPNPEPPPTLYTNQSNLKHTIALQQELFLANNHPLILRNNGQPAASSLKPHKMIKSDSVEDCLGWKVKIRPDGSRYITKSKKKTSTGSKTRHSPNAAHHAHKAKIKIPDQAKRRAYDEVLERKIRNLTIKDPDQHQERSARQVSDSRFKSKTQHSDQLSPHSSGTSSGNSLGSSGTSAVGLPTKDRLRPDQLPSAATISARTRLSVTIV